MNAKPVLLGLLAVATVVVAPSIYFRATFTPVKSAEVLAFSDGRYKAVRMSLSRSSASPFCYHSVSVLPAPLPESVAESEKEYQVYFAPCAGPGGAR